MIARALGLIVVTATIWVVSFAGFTNTELIPRLGLVPRDLGSALGVVAMPFVHGSLHHLIMNTIPFVTLSAIVLMRGGLHYALSLMTMTLLTGTILWGIGREGLHIGASGVVFGLLGYLIARAFVERRVTSFAVAMLVMFFYGSMLWGLFPADLAVSFEGHIAGFLAGIVTAKIYCRPGTAATRSATPA